MPNPTPVIPKLGRFGSIGIGKEVTAGTAVVPSNFLRLTAPGTPNLTMVRTRSNYANASIEAVAERLQGRTFQGKSLSFEVDLVGLKLLLELLLGAATATNAIIPLAGNVAANMPLTPATVEWNYPGNPMRAVGSQFYNLQLQMQNRANFTGTVNFHAIDATDMADPAAVVLPQALIAQFKHHYIQYNGVDVLPESSSLTLDNAIGPVDAARGNSPAVADLVIGFERTGPRMLSGQFSVSGTPAALRAAYRAGTVALLKWGLKIGTSVIEFEVANAEINLVDPPSTLERIVVPVNWTAVSLGGETAFKVNVLNV